MLKAVSTYLYVKERLHPGILDGLSRTGVQAIEIFAARQHLEPPRPRCMQRTRHELRSDAAPARLWRGLGVQQRDHVAGDAVVQYANRALGMELETGQGGIVAERG